MVPDVMLQLSKWMSERWKSGLAFVFSVVMIFDFVVLPTLHERKVNTVEYIQGIVENVPEAERTDLIKTILEPREPISAFGNGFLYLCIGGILTAGAMRENQNNTKDKK